ncbi:MAG: hypothetical protein WBW33_12915 [Bryobacteraceae bacterium]
MGLDPADDGVFVRRFEVTATGRAAFIQNSHTDDGCHDAAPIGNRVAEERAPMCVRVRRQIEKDPGYQHHTRHQTQHVALDEAPLVMLAGLRRNIVIL